jgi:hypothetical protein
VELAQVELALVELALVELAQVPLRHRPLLPIRHHRRRRPPRDNSASSHRAFESNLQYYWNTNLEPHACRLLKNT